jgi:hypothetical protein
VLINLWPPKLKETCFRACLGDFAFSNTEFWVFRFYLYFLNYLNIISKNKFFQYSQSFKKIAHPIGLLVSPFNHTHSKPSVPAKHFTLKKRKKKKKETETQKTL